MKLTDEQMQQALEAASEQLKEAAAREAEQQLGHMIRCAAHETLMPEIKAFVEQHIVPEVRARLLREKDGLIRAALEGADVIANALRDAMVAKAAEQLKGDYRTDRVLEALFK